MKLTKINFEILKVIHEIEGITLLNLGMHLRKNKISKHSDKQIQLHLDVLQRDKLITTVPKKVEKQYKVTTLGKKAVTESTHYINSLKHVIVKIDNTAELTEKKKKTQEDKSIGSYITWTNPAYSEENKRWEYYKKDQNNIILEIYHSESEEEIKEDHKSKVMSHIMAAMKPEKKEGERQYNPFNIKLSEEKKQELTIPSVKKHLKDTSIYLHNSAKYRIMEMKLEGYTVGEIQQTIMKEFDLKLLSVGLYISDVLEQIKVMSRDIMVETLQAHIDRYEDLYKWFRDNGYDKLALKTMERKEKLLGLHGEKFEGMVLNRLDGLKNGSRYIWSQLSDTEMQRLLTLVKRTVIIIQPKKENNE